jgi:rhodanese-related sulfurtransferase
MNFAGKINSILWEGQMNTQHRGKRISLVVLCVMSSPYAGTLAPARAPVQAAQSASQISRITASELKSKLSANEAVTILDVRDTNSYVNSNDQIKGSIHVKVRRLQSRLTQPPLSNVSRDSEVVTYCACPNDEASIRAAQILLDAGFKRVRVLQGGWQSWVRANGQVGKRAKA